MCFWSYCSQLKYQCLALGACTIVCWRPEPCSAKMNIAVAMICPSLRFPANLSACAILSHLSLSLCVCVCVCVCARARARSLVSKSKPCLYRQVPRKGHGRAAVRQLHHHHRQARPECPERRHCLRRLCRL